MAKSEHQKIKLVVLLDILRMYSDEEHPLSTNEIIRRLAEHGIETGRKALYSDIELLNEFGYEVLCIKSRSNLYYIVDRNFDVAELRILLDAVQSANFVTAKKTKELTDKIAALAGTHRAKLLTKNVIYAGGTKHSNEKIYYSIDSIDRAICMHKKVSFKYFDLDVHGDRKYRKNGEKYVVNPVSLVFNDDKYYLTCYNDKYKNLSNYRVDRMDEVTILNEEITPSDCAVDFNAHHHRKEAFSMYIGKSEKITFCVDESALDIIFDMFGEKTKFSYFGNKYKFSAHVQVSPTFYGWCALLGDKLRILSPQNVVDGYKAHLQSALNNYD